MCRNKERKYREWKNKPIRHKLTEHKNYSRLVKTKNTATKNIMRDINFPKKSYAEAIL